MSSKEGVLPGKAGQWGRLELRTQTPLDRSALRRKPRCQRAQATLALARKQHGGSLARQTAFPRRTVHPVAPGPAKVPRGQSEGSDVLLCGQACPAGQAVHVAAPPGAKKPGLQGMGG
jgi:hypothetical protein